MSAWYDAETETMTDAADLFEPQAAAGQMIHTPQPTGAGGMAIALLQAARFAGARDMKEMLAEARRCGQALAGSGFYSFPTGGATVSGPSIDMAYALANIWGRCRTSTEIVSVDGQEIVIRGQFTDLLTVAVTERDHMFTLSAAPGKFAKNAEQSDRWRAMQIQSAGSKAVRSAILSGLPAWFVDAAFDAAKAAKRQQDNPDAEPLKVLVSKTIGAFAARESGLTVAELEQWIGRPAPLWVADDIGLLRGLYKQFKDNELSEARVRADLVGEQAAPSKGKKADTKPTKPATQAAPPADARLGSLGLAAPAAQTAAPATVAEAAAVDPERAGLLQIVHGLEADLPGPATRGVRKALDIAAKAQAGDLPTEKLDAYRKALQGEADELALTGGDQ